MLNNIILIRRLIVFLKIVLSLFKFLLFFFIFKAIIKIFINFTIINIIYINAIRLFN